jgi:hypothetical protein
MDELREQALAKQRPYGFDKRRFAEVDEDRAFGGHA